MNAIISGLFYFLTLYKYVALFLIIFSAAIILPLPANTIVMAVGSYVSQGYFSFGESLFVALSANVLGDIVGYLLIRRYGKPLVRWLRIADANWFKRLEKYIRTYSRSTIFFTRFFTSFGSIINFLSGLIKVPLARFILFDFLGNFANILFFLTLGYFVGTQWADFASLFAIFGFTLSILIATAALVGLFWKS